MSLPETIDSISELPEEWGSYEPPSDFSSPPPAVEYTFMRSTETDHFKSGSFTMDDGTEAAWYNFRGLIQGGEFDGRVAFGGCNTLISKFRKGTTTQDFILAAGAKIRPTSAQLLAEVKAEKPSSLLSIVGPFKALTNWEWRCSGCEETFLKGAKNPKSPKKYQGPKVQIAAKIDGHTNPEQPCPLCGAKVMATLIISKFLVPKTAGTTATRPTLATAPSGMAPSAG